MMNRRDFLKSTAAMAGGLGFLTATRATLEASAPLAPAPLAPAFLAAAGEARAVQPFEISLAEWSLEKSLFAKKITNLDFPRIAKNDFGIDTVEYVDQFFEDRARDTAYLTELRKRCEGEGVRSGLIMIDTAGPLGAAGAERRARAVESHKAWLDAAKFLGCHSMRVNAHGDGGADELRGRVVESCGKLAEHGQKLDVNVIIENHGGNSSDPEWLTRVMREVNSPWFGTLPDFGNFPVAIDRYAAIGKMMPFARASVSAKTFKFDASRNEISTDYARMMKVVLDAGFRSYVGIECEGAEKQEDEMNHIRMAKAVIEKIRSAQPALQPLWNGKDLTGWAKVAGGEWTVEDGVLVARNGKDWSTDPSRTGSWLRTEKEYGDFELYVEYLAKARSNSGVFIRSGLERNPAFTGYEVQIHDDAGSPPRKGGPGSLYDVIAPAKNRVRPAGEWNQIRVIARGQSIRVHVNGEMVIDTTGDRNLKGYIGLQNHDDKSEVRFRNVQVVEM